MKKDFNAFRFDGLEHREISNNYFTMNRVNNSEDRIVVKVGDNHLLETRYGWALILDRENVVFLKEWQVSVNHFANEVMLTKQYFNVKKWGEHKAFAGTIEENHSFDTWLQAAKEQVAEEVKWNKVHVLK